MLFLLGGFFFQVVKSRSFSGGVQGSCVLANQKFAGFRFDTFKDGRFGLVNLLPDCLLIVDGQFFFADQLIWRSFPPFFQKVSCILFNLHWMI